MRARVASVLMCVFVAGSVALSSTGCSGVPGGAEGDLSRAAGAAAAATESVRFGLELVTEQRTTRAHAVTVVSDAHAQILEAYGSVATLEISTEEEAAHRALVLERLDDAVTLLGKTRAHIDGTAGTPGAEALGVALTDLADGLSALGEGAR